MGKINKEKYEQKWEKKGTKKTNIRERERKIKRGFRFSLRSTKIGPLALVGARGKASPRNGGYV